jgi:CRP-like cAMP-binding protein
MHLNEIRDRIGHIPVVHELPEDIRQRFAMILLGLGHEVTATDGQVLFEEGQGDDDVAYVMLEGTLLVEKSEVPALLVNAPELLGEVVKFSPLARRSATVTAQGDVKLLKFYWTPFFHAMDQVFNPDERLDVRHALEDIAWGHFAV